ncbi:MULTISPECIES: hypothetical protein [unclassified Meiothermus]|uniref:hypothetical protein n=1 Tax=unclassified Meiothermus TaxID=370471 RepID=UPI000D7BCE90|nr:MULTISPECIES: hypothetical protein [unclassified Meiothermus]PZA07750.1 hypothetical protein DNA98_05440 [Meiothermus sp. Pnk-1]RYM38950.1 hypothetical protein EWH23_04255 [Meiothermus sp. PNK-Is4]
MENLTESSTFDPNVSVPVDGVDRRTAASLRPAFQALANRSQYLKSEILDINGRLDTLESTSYYVKLYQQDAALSQSSPDLNPVYYAFSFNEIDDPFNMYNSGQLSVPRSELYLLRLFVSQVRCRIKRNNVEMFWAEHGSYDTTTVNMLYTPSGWAFSGREATSYSPDGRSYGVLHEDILALQAGDVLTFDYSRSDLYTLAPVIRLELYGLK